MKQLLFLLLFPCLALGQYQGNANQKITLGEQTTADGLVWRGVANDTNVITPFSDTSAYIILDTVNSKFYHYNRTTTYWALAGGGVSVSSFSAGTTGLTPSTATTGAVTLGGTLAVANGGTGASVRTFVDTINAQTVNGAKTFTSAVTGARFNPTENTATGTGIFLPAANTLGFSTNGTNRLTIDASGNLGLGVSSSAWYTGYTAMQIGESAALFSNRTSADTRITQLANNAFLNSNASAWIYAQSDEATRYGQVSGQHQWYTAPSGTAGNAITFTQAMTLDASGNLGIGTTTPAVQLHTTGNVRFAGLASITDLRTDADGDLFNGSDFNLKNSIDTINFGLSDVLKLKPVSFNWNNEGRNINEYKSMGFIAQDVMNVIPNAASTMGDGDMQVDYNAIVATLTKAIQEQQALIKALEQRILTLENK